MTIKTKNICTVLELVRFVYRILYCVLNAEPFCETDEIKRTFKNCKEMFIDLTDVNSNTLCHPVIFLFLDFQINILRVVASW